MIKNKRFILISIIYNDLRTYGKMQLFLLLLIIISAISVMIITYQTRSLIIDRERFLLEKESLENKWSSLVLKKEILSNHTRIEDIAINKLHMHYVNSTLNNVFDASKLN